ncbi:sensor histidine kinase [Gracilibacillus sp. YIM 98692]|uniref:sensor histidine kinase n=1 Tax=Gracilibacillus sp. YIM 98692 TaxID=2663532 RepID=UPI0013D7F7A3|nr:sensor histidine kinase [Gracilibacillus sp. YIM 98692]
MISKLIAPFKNYRFTSKLMITYILLTVIPMAFLGYISYNQYTKSIEQQAGENYPKLLRQAKMNIDQQLSEIQKLNELLYSSSTIMSILRTEEYQNQSALLRDQFEMNTYLSRTFLSGIHSDILAVFVQSNDRLFHSTRVPLVEEVNSTNLQHISYNRAIPFYETELRFEGDIPYLMLEREIIDFDNRESLGTMYIVVDIRFVDRVIQDISEKADVWIMDHNQRFIYHTDQEKIGRIYDEIKRIPVFNGSFKTLSEEDNKVMSVSQSEKNDWTFVHSIQTKYLTEQTNLVRNVTIIFFIVFVLISAIISILLAWNVTKPIHQLKLLMKDVEKGNFNVDLSMNSKDEVGMLAKSFNSMVYRIKELIRINYQTGLRQKEAELYALQSQINPHFMYNTLETISMSVEEGETDSVVEMVALLGQMLRYSLSNKDEVVPITTEVSHIKDYLIIQKYRFEERLSFKVEEKIDISLYNTPKFILQPIVENAIKYTIERNELANVTIIIAKETFDAGEETIVFRIVDNGPGIPPDKLKYLETLLKDDPMTKKSSSFGLLNVHARIAIMFGDNYGITINSHENMGTEIEIRIPVLDRLKEEVVES